MYKVYSFNENENYFCDNLEDLIHCLDNLYSVWLDTTEYKVYELKDTEIVYIR